MYLNKLFFSNSEGKKIIHLSCKNIIFNKMANFMMILLIL